MPINRRARIFFAILALMLALPFAGAVLAYWRDHSMARVTMAAFAMAVAGVLWVHLVAGVIRFSGSAIVRRADSPLEFWLSWGAFAVVYAAMVAQVFI